MIKIAVDAMGGDYAPSAPVEGVYYALKEVEDIEIYLVGKKEQLEEEISRIDPEKVAATRWEIIDAREVIGADENPTTAIKEKSEASMVKCMELVKSGTVHAMISAGNTGAFMAGGLLKVGRLPGIKRPALAPIFPTFDGRGTVVLDVGATMDPKPEHLRDFGIMGSLYAQKVLDRETPRVALINVGEEPGKGNTLAKETYQKLNEAPVHFIGNIEARDLLSGEIDVAVCEGFMGNVLLKFLEGIGKNMFQAMKEEFTADVRGKIGAYILKPGLKKIHARFDYNEYGGAPFLGIDGVLVKSHGSSKAAAFKNAIKKQGYQFVKHEVLSSFSQGLKKGAITDE